MVSETQDIRHTNYRILMIYDKLKFYTKIKYKCCIDLIVLLALILQNDE